MPANKLPTVIMLHSHAHVVPSSVAVDILIVVVGIAVIAFLCFTQGFLPPPLRKVIEINFYRLVRKPIDGALITAHHRPHRRHHRIDRPEAIVTTLRLNHDPLTHAALSRTRRACFTYGFNWPSTGGFARTSAARRFARANVHSA